VQLALAPAALRRLDAVLEPTKKQVLETKAMLDKAGITEQHAALCKASDQAFTSKPILYSANRGRAGRG
jgi:hypothetical protein